MTKKIIFAGIVCSKCWEISDKWQKIDDRFICQDCIEIDENGLPVEIKKAAQNRQLKRGEKKEEIHTIS